VRLRSASILASVFVVATCGLVHELLAATLASYVLGNSVRQYALVIGLYLSAMGVGALLSRRVSTGLARWFVGVELALALVGGLSVPALHLLFGHLATFGPALYSVVFAIGVMVGTELPLLMRLLDDDLSFRELVSRSLLADHIGSLAAALLFPLALVPYVGLLRTGVLVGLCNAAVALWGAWFLRGSLGRASTPLRVAGVLVALTLAAAWRLSPLVEAHAERAMDAVG